MSLHSSRLRLLEAFLHSSDRLAIRIRGNSSRAEHLEVGRRGEEAAYLYLRRLGYTVVARGWRSAKLPGDLDLIAWEGAALCFIEVKTRTARDFAAAESAVDQDKMRTLRRMGRQYLRALTSPPESVRFDVLSVYFEREEAAEFELFRDAFGSY